MAEEMELMKFDDKKVVGKVKIEYALTEQELNYIICGALEGAISYWARLVKEGKEWDERPKTAFMSDWATKIIADGGSLKLKDIEDEENEVPLLTLDGILKGIALNHQKRPHDCNLDNADDFTYDAIIQYSVFGKLVYG